MKDQLLKIVGQINDEQMKLNAMREYLQIYALRAMHEGGYFKNLSFVGGTCLRFINDLPRFSEDLDFSLLNGSGYDFEKILKDLKQGFQMSAYKIEITWKTEKIVQAAFLKFPEIMHEAGLSGRKDQKLTIKLDVDTNPPRGAVVQRTLINKYFPVAITHNDLPSLLSGKLHAIITRPYVKGRDYFDLVWILSRRRDISPNIGLLRNSLKQTGNNIKISAKDWREKIWDHIKGVNWKEIVADVERFVEDVSLIDMMRPENIESLLK